MKKFNFFTGRNDAKTLFWAIVTKPVEGESDYHVAHDLSNVVALVEYNKEADEMAVHVEKDPLTQILQIGASSDMLCDAALRLSEHLDEGRNADPEHRMDPDTPFYPDHKVTFFMEVE